jgi:hypothetical protein
MPKSAIAKLPQTDRRLRESVLRLLRKQGLHASGLVRGTTDIRTKDQVRDAHSLFRSHRLSDDARFVERWFHRVEPFLASGCDVDPSLIDPYPVVVEPGDELSSAIFRIASLWWSVPVSKGFGRRFRVLVFDRSNGKLFGLLGLTDPVFNLRTRDDWIGWDVRQREEALVNVMDAYVLGAVPPYNELLGAKYVALLAASDYVRNVFRRRYALSRSIILKRCASPKLALVTTSSALGKSSIYNRLRIEGEDVFKFVGFTRGFGHFHLANGTFSALRALLDRHDDQESTKYKFGSGPNYRFRVARRALEYLHLPPELLKHGVQRAVYVAPLARNSPAYLRGEAKRLLWHGRSLQEIGQLWKSRWLLPRAETNKKYLEFRLADWTRILS